MRTATQPRIHPWTNLTDLADQVRTVIARMADPADATRALLVALNPLRDANNTQLCALTADPVDTGFPRWNALIEGLVARIHHIRGLPAPEWTNTTRLDQVWSPYGHRIASDAWYVLDVLTTPAELLHRSVVLPARDVGDRRTPPDRNMLPGPFRQLSDRLDAELSKRSTRAHVLVLEGTNITFALDDSRTSADIESAIYDGWAMVFAAANSAAVGVDAEPGWLRDELQPTASSIATAWVGDVDENQPRVGLVGRSLTVELVSAEVMLAVKSMVQRDRDIQDIRSLMYALGVGTAEGLVANVVAHAGARVFDQVSRPGPGFFVDPTFPALFDYRPVAPRRARSRLVRRRIRSS